ncbi:hypothetical protein KY343_07120 [Candidatus Woesearchaeota archaeon]|nr:hypothetical protein [Candidatus Woesearchaeota archaeon]
MATSKKYKERVYTLSREKSSKLHRNHGYIGNLDVALLISIILLLMNFIKDIVMSKISDTSYFFEGIINVVMILLLVIIFIIIDNYHFTLTHAIEIKEKRLGKQKAFEYIDNVLG